jgi:Ca-activated chloride channel homolog
MGKKSRIPVVFLLVIIVALLFGACDKRDPVQPPAPTGNAQFETDTSSDPSLSKRKGIWLSASDGSVALADNLLAKNYYVVQDGSGSMIHSECSGGKSKSEVSKKALAEFAKAVPSDVNLGLLAFDSRGVTERLSLGINNRTQFINAVNDVYADSGTPLHNAIVGGLRALEKQARKQLGYGEYHLVIITDGYANIGQDPMEAIDWMVTNTPIIIHAIGFCTDNKHSLNQPGKTYYATAQNPAELTSSLKAVLAESEHFDDVKTFQK